MTALNDGGSTIGVDTRSAEIGEMIQSGQDEIHLKFPRISALIECQGLLGALFEAQ